MRVPSLLLLTAQFLFAPISASAQMNGKGTFHLSLGVHAAGHATEYEQRLLVLGQWLSDTNDDGAASVTFPFELGFGLSKGFALGIYVEPGSYLDSSATESNAILLAGLQPRIYLVNNDRFAWMASVLLGVSALRIERSEALVSTDARYSGGNFGLSTGVAFGLGDLLALQFQLRYMTTNMPLRAYELNGASVDLSGYEATLRTRGLGAQLSLAFRF
ncbi:MAG: hypothetical protein JNL52_06420 [Flavobacteriales bacterium]|nr:hypothetical protein [Flavobacteriales bacterium]